MKIELELPFSQIRRLREDAPEGLRFSLPSGVEGRRDGGSFDPLALVVISSILSVPSGVFVAWIIRHLDKSDNAQITINRRRIDYRKDGSVKRILEDEIHRCGNDSTRDKRE